MKAKQEQIEDMCEAIASMICQIYNPQCDEYEPHTCSHCYANDTLIGDFAEMLYNAGYRKIDDFEAENEQLKAKLKVRLTYDFVKTAQTHAVQDFAEKVKGKSEMFLVAKGDGVYGEKPYVSIEKIDELLKE